MNKYIFLKGNNLNKNIIFFLIILLYINSCSFLKQNKSYLKKNNNSEKNKNLIFLNFDNAIENIILEMSHDQNIFFSKKILLYINILKNESNIFLENKKLTNSIREKIKKINKITIINSNQIKKTKKELGLSENNKFLNTSTAILIARKNNATYYLDSKIIKNNKLLILEVKLIFVKTGEIIFHKIKKFFIL
ncbi:hypothetical protein D9V64_01815 [Buchnera aphidicola (Aphis nerii)]|uniref:Penicillin-binding protein activator LpoB n=1 Tax=Buchnera aphidicola (Aphis nerii) TaxID=1241835 RepID=A0A4D6XWD2_9GAMM|nr:hypothetical protein D9V64_01815 [Buchnera aphidicola (Aphis nerii)]